MANTSFTTAFTEALSTSAPTLTPATANLVGTNSSPSPVQDLNTTDSAAVDGAVAARGLFLALFLLLGLLGNSLLIATIASAERLRNVVFNIFLINLATTNLADCLLNIPFVLASTTAADGLPLNSTATILPCQFNSFFVQFINIELILLICTMCWDRVMALREPLQYSVLASPLRAGAVLGYTWAHSLAFSLCILIGTPASVYYSARFLCSLSPHDSLAYVVVVSIFCFLLPLLMIIMAFCVILKYIVSERSRVKAMGQFQYTDAVLPHDQAFWAEVDIAKLTGMIVVSFIVLRAPYIMTALIHVYTASQADLDYASQVDTTLVWLMFSHAVFLPIVAFSKKKELGQAFKDMVLCRKSNSIIDSAKDNTLTTQVAFDQELRHSKARLPTSPTFNVPVLFSTSEGLHYHVSSQERLSIQAADFSSLESGMKSPDMLLSGSKKCDVDEGGGNDSGTEMSQEEESDGEATGESAGQELTTPRLWDRETPVEPSGQELTTPRLEKGGSFPRLRPLSQTDISLNRIRTSSSSAP
ncbi:histamine H2 receptor-like [Branchiostoma floridae x Branchiostoma japonicum]